MVWDRCQSHGEKRTINFQIATHNFRISSIEEAIPTASSLDNPLTTSQQDFNLDTNSATYVTSIFQVQQH
jgi:hypothetical protein